MRIGFIRIQNYTEIRFGWKIRYLRLAATGWKKREQNQVLKKLIIKIRKNNERERVVEQQNQQFQQMHREISEKNEQIRELENRETELSNADIRNLQFLVNCVAKTYKIEFRKNRAPAVKLALENIIERFDLHTPDEMENE